MRDRSGMNLIEVLIAASVLMTVLLGIGLYQVVLAQGNVREKDRVFAVQKTVQIMEEILAYQAAKGGRLSDKDVEGFANRANTFSHILSIDAKTTPSMPLSGNKAEGASYRYVRQVLFEPLPNDPEAARVKVAVFYAKSNVSAAEAASTRPLASLVNIVRFMPPASQPTQVYDVYVIAIENALNWWADPSVAMSELNDALRFMQTKNSGLEFRVHRISKLSYGRDPYYMPAANLDDAIGDLDDWVYLYPGTRGASLRAEGPQHNGQDASDHFAASELKGQAIVDGGAQNRVSRGNSDSNLYLNQANYAFADQYNHALRQPQEASKQSVVGGEPTLRQLLDELASGKWKNAIIVNLHGDVLPVPPVRNYSDAARVPQGPDKGWIKDRFGIDPSDDSSIAHGAKARIVTHPKVLKVDASTTGTYAASNTVDLHVYPYMTDASTTVEPAEKYREVQIHLKGVLPLLHSWNSADGSSGDIKDIEILACHKDGSTYLWRRIWPSDSVSMVGSTYNGYNYNVAVDPFPSGDSGKGIGAGDVRIKIKDVPYTVPTVGSRGTTTLHGMKYLPDPLLPYLDQPWASSTTPEPRNTARFRILFKSKETNKVIPVLTTIGFDSEELKKHQAPNRSTTYVWVGPDDPPLSERYQFQGDPRHNPYLDVRDAAQAGGPRYNRHFGAFTSNAYITGNASPWNSFPQTSDGYGTSPDASDVDVPRLFELWRSALLGGNAMFVNMSGLAVSKYSLGGEVFDFVAEEPFSPSGNSVALQNEITGASRLVGAEGTSGTPWYAKPWLGELYPNNQWDSWYDDGNLPSSGFDRRTYSGGSNDLIGYGAPNFARNRKLGPDGLAAFFNGGSTNDGTRWIAQVADAGANGTTNEYGDDMNGRLKTELENALLGERPFVLDDQTPANQPPGWALADVVGWRTKLEYGMFKNGVGTILPGGYYKNATAGRWSTVPVTIARNGKIGYAVLNSVAPTPVDDTRKLTARTAVAATLQGFFDMAHPKLSDNTTAKGGEEIRLLPRIEITAPAVDTHTNTVGAITWKVDWQRWDIGNYSIGFTVADYATSKPPVVFNIKYSEGGDNWSFINSNRTAQKGLFDSTEAIGTTSDSGLTYSATWTGSPNKNVSLRLECFRDLSGYRSTHYAYHLIPLKKN